MALPPQILRIKRKRGNEPVESLYLDSQPSSAKRRVTTSAAEFVFRRVVNENSETSAPHVEKSASGIPQLITTQPGEENGFFRRKQELVNAANSNAKGARFTTDATPRVFHLAKPSAPPKPRTSDSKRRRTLHHESDIAVFVEHSIGISESIIEASNETVDSKDLLKPIVKAQPPEQLPTVKKRPKTMATRSQPVTPVKQSEDQNTSEIHAALQRFAAEELEISSEDHGEVEANSDAMDTSPDVTHTPPNDESDYIYDTYMRYSNIVETSPDGKEINGPDSQSRTSDEMPVESSFGFLVIPEEDQELWEMYHAPWEFSESEKDWDSEEDDENHENYYGADYPEDEVSSGDDRDENPYHYTADSELGSDDEDGDSDSDEWSDGGEGNNTFWNRRAMTHGA